LLSTYEQETVFIEIIKLMSTELANDFEVNQVIIKAPPDEPERVSALTANHFLSYEAEDFFYKQYYMKSIPIG